MDRHAVHRRVELVVAAVGSHVADRLCGNRELIFEEGGMDVLYPHALPGEDRVTER